MPYNQHWVGLAVIEEGCVSTLALRRFSRALKQQNMSYVLGRQAALAALDELMNTMAIYPDLNTRVPDGPHFYFGLDGLGRLLNDLRGALEYRDVVNNKASPTAAARGGNELDMAFASLQDSFKAIISFRTQLDGFMSTIGHVHTRATVEPLLNLVWT